MKLRKISFKIISMIMVLAMSLSVCATTISATTMAGAESQKSGSESTEKKDSLIYVSLGDSMTNGYGLDGYQFEKTEALDALDRLYTILKDKNDPTADSIADGLIPEWKKWPINNMNGVLMEADKAYPTLFREHLAQSTGKNVDLIQLGMSGARVNEIWYILSQATDHPYAGDDYVTKSGYLTQYNHFLYSLMGYDIPDEIDWDPVDFWTNADPNYFYGTWAEYYGDGALAGTYPAVVEALGDLYVKSVKAADIISLNAGINNFGVYMLHFIENVFNVEFDGTDLNEQWIYESDFESIMVYATEEEEAEIRKYYEKITSMTEEMIAELTLDAEKEQYMRDFTKHMTYTYACFCIGYTRTLECIAELNDDVTIVMMNMINYLTDLKISTPYGLVDYGKIFGLTMDSANAYAARVAEEFNADSDFGPEILYADAGNDIELLMAELVETNGDFSGYDITRQRLLETYLFNIGKENLFTLSDIVAYEAALAALESGDGSAMSQFMKEKDTFAAGIEGWYTWIAAVENQLKVCEEWRTYPWEHLAGAFGVSTEAEVKATIDAVEAQYETYLEEAYIGLEADLAKADAAQAETLKLYGGYLGFEKGMIQALKRQNLNIELFISMEQSGTTSILSQMFAEAQTNSENLGAGYAGKIALLDDIINADAAAAALAYGDALASTISNSDLYTSMLYLLAYFKVGSGVMCHPSNDGHAEMAKAICAAYENKTKPNAKKFINDRIDEYMTLVEDVSEFLNENEALTAAEKVALLLKTLDAVKSFEIFDENNTIIAVEEVYYALDANDLLTDDHVIAIVVSVLDAITDDADVSYAEAREIAGYIYFEVLATATVQRARSAIALTPITPAMKLEIIETVYDILKNNEVIDVTPDIDALVDLYYDISDEELLTAEQILGIMDKVVDTFVVEEEITDEVIAEVSAEIVEDILTDPTIPTENKLAILEKVADTLGKMDMGDVNVSVPEIPYLDVIKALQKNLKNAGYLSDEQVTEIIDRFYGVLTSGEVSADVLLDAVTYTYDVIFERANLTTEDMILVVVITLATVYEDVELTKEYFDPAYAMAHNILRQTGAMDHAKNGLEIAIKTLEDLVFELRDLDSEYPEFAEYIEKMLHEITLATETIEAIIVYLDAETLDSLMAQDFGTLIENLKDHAGNLIELADKANVDLGIALDYVVGEAEEYYDYYSKLAAEYLKDESANLYNWFVEEILANADVYGEQAVAYMYNWFMENKEGLITEIVENVRDVVNFVNKYEDEIFAAIGFFATNYDDKFVNHVLDNAGLIIPAVVSIISGRGQEAWDIVAVYAELLLAYVDTDLTNKDEILTATGEIADLLVELGEKLETFAKTHAEADKLAVKTTIEKVEAKLKELRPYFIEEGKNYTANLFAEMYENVYAIVRDFVEENIKTDFTPAEDTKFVSVNGGNAYYAELLAAALSNEDFQIKPSYTIWGELDYDMLAAADLITIGYDENELSAFAIDQLIAYVSKFIRVDLNDSINAYVDDVITTIVENHNILSGEKFAEVVEELQNYVTETINAEIINNSVYPLPTTDPVEFDWAKFVGEDNVSIIEEALGLVRAELVKAGIVENYVESINMLDTLIENEQFADIVEYISMDEVRKTLGDKANYNLTIPVVDSIMYAIEAYLYSYVEFQAEYAELLIKLSDINPDATVILLGHYNAFDFDLEIGESTIDLSKAYSYVATAAGVTPLAYAVINSNVAFVDITKAETKYDVLLSESDEYKTLEKFLVTYLVNPGITDISKAGNEYIAEQILNVLTVGCSHHYDNDCDAICNWCGFEREVAGHVYDGPCDEICNVCGFKREGAGHTYNSNSCEARCIVCGHLRGSGQHKIADCTVGQCILCGEFVGTAEHVFNGCEDAFCRNCDYERTPGKHVYVDCDDLTCEACGMTRVAVKHQYDNACDANCNVCNKAREAAAHVYSGCEDTDCNVCGLTREAGKHVTSDCIDTECDLCGYPVLAKGHSFGDWELTLKAKGKKPGIETRTCSVCQFTETREIYGKGIGGGAIVAIVAGSIIVVDIAAFAIYWFVIQKKSMAQLLAVFSKPAEVATDAPVKDKEEDNKN